MAPASVGALREPGPQRTKEATVDSKTIQRNALTDEVKRTILREATTRFNSELMDDEERLLLFDRIKRLRRQLGL